VIRAGTVYTAPVRLVSGRFRRLDNRSGNGHMTIDGHPLLRTRLFDKHEIIGLTLSQDMKACVCRKSGGPEMYGQICGQMCITSSMHTWGHR
jgi:hypothetical protein